jgi:hypothetical protein
VDFRCCAKDRMEKKDPESLYLQGYKLNSVQCNMHVQNILFFRVPGNFRTPIQKCNLYTAPFGTAKIGMYRKH